MTRKQKRQLELKYIIHRCQNCGRELKHKDSVQKGRGKACHKKYQRDLAGLRELAAFWNT